MQNVPVTRCTRYNADGTACLNDTSYQDRWCRESGCPGFTRPSSVSAPRLKDVKFYGSPEEIAKTGSNPAAIRGTAETVDISPKAISNFKFHHGGTDAEAEIQIRWMLADFLNKSGRTVTEANYLALSRGGYRLHVGPSRNRITSYSTTHRERTWEQIKLGIPSRIGMTKAEAMPILPSLQPREPEPAAPRKPTPITLAGIKAPVAESRHTISEDASSPARVGAQEQPAPRKPNPREPIGTEADAGTEHSAPPIVTGEQQIAPRTGRERIVSEADPLRRNEELIANRSAESISAPHAADTQTRPATTVTHAVSAVPRRNGRLVAIAASTIAAVWLTKAKRARKR